MSRSSDSQPGAHWLELRLNGTDSNRDGVGARIKVSAGGSVQYDHVSFATGYASSSAASTHFGIGAAKLVDSVEIRWPSGTVQQLRNVAADQVLKVKEPAKNNASPWVGG